MKKYNSDGILINDQEGGSASRLIAWFFVWIVIYFGLYIFTKIPIYTIVAMCTILGSICAILDTIIVSGTIDSWIGYRKRMKELQSETDKFQNRRIDSLEARIIMLEKTMFVTSGDDERVISKYDDTDQEILAYCESYLFVDGSPRINSTGRISTKYRNVISQTAHEKLERRGWVSQDGSNYYWKGPESITEVIDNLA